MNKQASRESFFVRAENAPVWLPWGLALLGLIGSLISAHLFLADWHGPSAQSPKPIEIGASAIRPAPPSAEAAREEGWESSGLEDGPASIQQPVDSGSTGEADVETTVVAATDQTPTGIGLAGDIGANRDAADSDSQFMQADEQPQVAQPIGTESESETAPVSSSAEISGSGSTTPDTVGREQAGSTYLQSESAELLEAQESRQASIPITEGQPNALQAQLQHDEDTETERSIDESAIDCAPLFSISFDHGSIEPRGSNMEEKITRLARWMNAHPAAMVYVDGHADSSGTEEINLVVSFRRAAATAALLTEAGASRSQLVVRAYGEGPSLSPSAQSQPERRVTLATDASMSCGQRAFSDGGPQ